MKRKYLILLLVFALCLVGCGVVKESNEFDSDNYVDSSRKKVYYDTIESYVKSVSTKVNEGTKLLFYNTNVLYLVPIGYEPETSCVILESGGNSPFNSKWNWAYVGVMYDSGANSYRYYVIAEDGSGNGITFSKRNEISDLYRSSKANERGYRLIKELYNQHSNKVYKSSSDYDELKTILSTDLPYDTIAVVGSPESGPSDCKFSSSDLY